MIRAAIYARVSTDQQANEGDSIPAQIDALTRYVNDHDDMILAGEYIDGGVSGTKADREELTRLTADIVAGKIDRVLVTKLDRLYRSIRHYVNTMEVWEAHGVGWTAIWEPMYDTTTPQGRLVVNQMMSIAQFEAENTSQRIKAVMEYKVSQGEAVTGKVPIGYRIQGKHLVIDQEEADKARQIFDSFAVSGSIGEAARMAAALGHPFHRKTIKNMLTNRKYIGEHRGNPNYCPPIIDRDLFEDVQRKLTMAVRYDAKHVSIFTGLIKCGACGRRLGALHDAKHRSPRYRCQGHFQPPKNCPNPHSISETTIEKYLINEVQKVAREVKAEQVEEQKKVVDHTAQIAAIDRRISRLKELYLAEMITLEEYKRDKEEMEQKKAALRVPDVPKNDSKVLDDILAINDLKGLILGLTPAERRYLWRGMVKEIVFFPDRHLELHF